jgi:hypothetical protein
VKADLFGIQDWHNFKSIRVSAGTAAVTAALRRSEGLLFNSNPAP